MDKLNESLLNAWLRLSTSVINPRMVSEMSYNESLVCNVLYNHQNSDSTEKLTATDLCRETRMLKSQMNRTLTLLEQKEIILRERAPEDKRKVWVTLNLEKAHLYATQHERIITFIDKLIEHIGEDQAVQAVHMINTLSDTADKLLDDFQKGQI